MTSEYHRGSVQGFDIHTVSNAAVSLSIAPELGGKIVSLRDRINDREWLDGWDPPRLWSSDPSNYDTSTGGGIDECLPTVLGCDQHPDHGEIWAQPATFEPHDSLRCTWQLKHLPLHFSRTTELIDNTVVLSYRLENLGSTIVRYLYAWHPLFTLEEGDLLTFAPEIQWPDAALATADLGAADPPWAKHFLGPFPPSTGLAQIAGKKATLSIEWPTTEFPWIGLWITRGAWQNRHHWAVEPTNAPYDKLTEIPTGYTRSQLEPDELRCWTLTLSLEPSISDDAPRD